MRVQTEIWEDVLTIKNGKSQKKVVNPNGAYPIYGSGGIMGRADDFLCDEGTTIIGRKGSINKPIYVDEKFWNVDTAFGLVPGEKLDKKFFYYFCTTYNFLKHNKATTLPSLTKADLLKISMPVPSLDTQRKIASILDAADAYRQKTKALIEKYDELTQSLFLEMFGDPFTNKKEFPVYKMGELCEELFLGLTSKVDYVEKGGYPLIRAKDINKGILSFEQVKFISEVQHKKLTSRRVTRRGDVLISKSGTLGTCAIVNSDKEFSTYESIFTVRPKVEMLSNTFLIYLVRNESFQLKLLGNQVGGTVAHLNLKMFRDFEFPLPPVAEQYRFTERALQIETQKKQAQQSLEKSEELFNSLLQRTFKGEMD